MGSGLSLLLGDELAALWGLGTDTLGAAANIKAVFPGACVLPAELDPAEAAP